jgi:general secretion pathway protein G
MARRRAEPRVFFPWEKRRGIFGAIGRARVRLLICVASIAVFVMAIRRREENAAAVRATRASLTTAWHGVLSYRADHGGACPKGTGELVAGGYVRDTPIDAWGHPLRLVCPGRKDPLGFDLSSDGPDGVPGGLDRVE